MRRAWSLTCADSVLVYRDVKIFNLVLGCSEVAPYMTLMYWQVASILTSVMPSVIHGFSHWQYSSTTNHTKHPSLATWLFSICYQDLMSRQMLSANQWRHGLSIWNSVVTVGINYYKIVRSDVQYKLQESKQPIYSFARENMHLTLAQRNAEALLASLQIVSDLGTSHKLKLVPTRVAGHIFRDVLQVVHSIGHFQLMRLDGSSRKTWWKLGCI